MAKIAMKIEKAVRDYPNLNYTHWPEIDSKP